LVGRVRPAGGPLSRDHRGRARLVTVSDAGPRRRPVRAPTGARPPLLAVEVLSPSDHKTLAQGISRIEGKRRDHAANGLRHHLEVERVAGECTIRRYELHDGRLEVTEVVEGDKPLVATVPYDYEVRPSRL
jgi:hypothetical protein